MRSECIAAAILLIGSAESHAICYVNSHAPAGGTGLSWSSAFSDLQTALESSCSEVHVAAGIYKPSTVGNPDESFNVLPGVQLMGGYDGAGADPDHRDPWKNLTILSGDIGNDDVTASTTQIDDSTADIVGTNTHHVIYLDGTRSPITASTRIDGFTVTGGAAVGTGPISGYTLDGVGGGLLCRGDGASNKCDPTLQSLVFSGNYGRAGGAVGNFGRYNGESSPQIFDSRFHGNRSLHAGGAVLNDANSGTASPIITNTTFDANESDEEGGAVGNLGWFGGQSIPRITNTTFYGNGAPLGAAIYSTGYSAGLGGAYLISDTLYANKNSTGASIVNDGTSGFSEVLALNTIIWDGESDNEVEDIQANSEFDHSILKGGCSLTASRCTNVTTTDPNLGALQNYGGYVPTLLPDSTSPAIDAGSDNPVMCPSSDERGVARPQLTHCDIGAVERLPIEDLIFRSEFEE